MPYTKFQFIAHVINTLPQELNIQQDADKTTKKAYLGLANEKEDIDARVALVKKVIETASANENVKRYPDVLKIFMMPEFFFRGAKGAYEMENVAYLVNELQKIVATDKRWQHWLFVFGTIIGKSYPTKDTRGIFKKLTTSDAVIRIDKTKPLEVYNFALVQKGGFLKEEAPNYAHVIMKQHKSDIDFIEQDTLHDQGVVDEKAKHLETVKLSDTDKRFREESIFTRDRINWGLEICKDHNKKRLRTIVEHDNKKLDIILLTSCGINIYGDAIPPEMLGYLLQCEGSLEQSEVRKLLGLDPIFLPQNRKPKTKKIQILKEIKLDINDIKIKSNQDNKISLSLLFNPTKPKSNWSDKADSLKAGYLDIYPVLDLPASVLNRKEKKSDLPPASLQKSQAKSLLSGSLSASFSNNEVLVEDREKNRFISLEKSLKKVSDRQFFLGKTDNKFASNNRIFELQQQLKRVKDKPKI